MNNLPDTVQWLIDFANLGCYSGELNPQRQDKIFRLKRPPIEPPPGITSLTLGECPHTGLDSNIVTDNKGYEWLRTWRKPIFLGKKDHHLSLEEFRKFFLKAGIPPNETIESFLIDIHDICSIRVFLKEDESGKNYIYKGILEPKNDCKETYPEIQRFLNSFWIITWRALIRVIRMYNREEVRGFSVKELEDHIYKHYTASQPNSSDYETVPLDRTGRVFTHDNTLPCAIYAYILDLWYNHKGLHSRLKHCQCCGKFWFEPENKRPGRKRIFCSEDCKRVFHQQSRSDNQKAVKITRDHLKEKKQKEDYSQLIKFLLKNGYTQNEAEKESFEWVCKKGKSFKEFKRTRAVSYGLK